MDRTFDVFRDPHIVVVRDSFTFLFRFFLSPLRAKHSYVDVGISIAGSNVFARNGTPLARATNVLITTGDILEQKFGILVPRQRH